MEKALCISGPVPSKPMLLKGQVEQHYQKADRN